jgi:fumarate reductase subunit C
MVPLHHNIMIIFINAIFVLFLMFLLTTWYWMFPKNVIITRVVKKVTAIMEPEVSLPHSQHVHPLLEQLI